MLKTQESEQAVWVAGIVNIKCAFVWGNRKLSSLYGNEFYMGWEQISWRIYGCVVNATALSFIAHCSRAEFFSVSYLSQIMEHRIKLSTLLCYSKCFKSRIPTKSSSSNKHLIFSIIFVLLLPGSFPKGGSGLQKWHGRISESAGKTVDFLSQGSFELLSSWRFTLLL